MRRPGKTETPAPMKVLLLLALHAALLHQAAAAIQCPQGYKYRDYTILGLTGCPSEESECCVYEDTHGGWGMEWRCGSKTKCKEQSVKGIIKCVPTPEKPCCWKKPGAFHTNNYPEQCDKLARVIQCPQRGEEGLWTDQKACPKKKSPCCKYEADGNLDYTCGGDCGGGPDECQPSLNGKKCCAKPDGSGGFVSKTTREDCESKAQPRCPVGLAGSTRDKPAESFQTCVSGCCAYDRTTKKFACEATKQGKCISDTETKQACRATTKIAELHCCPMYEGGFVPRDQKCCLNQYKDGYVGVDEAGQCPQPLKCPTEVAEEPDQVTCDGVRGECCVMDSSGKSVCATGEQCENDGACRPLDGSQKCCLSRLGTAVEVAVVPLDARCELNMPKCPSSAAQPAEYCDSGCCVYDYASRKFSCATAGTDGECPDTGKTQQTCKATPGLPCCAKLNGGGFRPEQSGKCASPDLSCPLEVAGQPAVRRCASECCVLDGAGKTVCAKGDRCEKPGVCRPALNQKCCLNRLGTAVEAVARGSLCPHQCKDKKIFKLTECEKQWSEEDREWCSGRAERCAEDEGVSKAGAAGGKDCAEAWAKCEKGAAEAHGPSLLVPALLILLLLQ